MKYLEHKIFDNQNFEKDKDFLYKRHKISKLKNESNFEIAGTISKK